MERLEKQLYAMAHNYTGSTLDEYLILHIKQEAYKILFTEAVAQRGGQALMPGRFDISVYADGPQIYFAPRNLFTLCFMAGVHIDNIPAWVLRHDGPGEVTIGDALYIHTTGVDGGRDENTVITAQRYTKPNYLSINNTIRI